MDVKLETMMNGRDAYFNNLDKKVDELQGMLKERPLALHDVDDHVETACLSHYIKSTLDDVVSRVDDADQEIRDKMHDLLEWAAFKSMKNDLYKVLD
jgi:hypothetical protein